MKPFRSVLGHGEIPFPNGSHFIDLQHIDLALITNSVVDDMEELLKKTLLLICREAFTFG
jgi:hypothetical protein